MNFEQWLIEHGFVKHGSTYSHRSYKALMVRKDERSRRWLLGKEDRGIFPPRRYRLRSVMLDDAAIDHTKQLIASVAGDIL